MCFFFVHFAVEIIIKNIVHEGVLDQDFDNVDNYHIRLVGGFFCFNLIDNEQHDFNNDCKGECV